MILSAEQDFDGVRMHDRASVTVENGRIAGIGPAAGEVMRGTLAPGLIDLQVNGGGGATAAPDSLDRICEAHALMGSIGVLPTLITDTPEMTAAVIAAGIAMAAGIIADGVHVDPLLLRLALANPRLFLVTDCMAVAGGGAGRHGADRRRGDAGLARG